jgi:phosphatidylglycerophosphate synthase
VFFTIPTLLTWARIAAIPLIIGVYYLDWPMATKNLVATSMFVLFAATDWLDGYLARKLNQTSAFGAFLDPVADKILVCAALLVLLERAALPGLRVRAPPAPGVLTGCSRVNVASLTRSLARSAPKATATRRRARSTTR